jgi:membrane-associated progesterone receptor component
VSKVLTTSPSVPLPLGRVFSLPNLPSSHTIPAYVITFLVSFLIWYYLNGGFKTPEPPKQEEPEEPPIPNNFTLEKLAKFDGSTDETVPNPIPTSIYVSVDSTVFDVSSGRDFYGPGGAYAMFAGKEIGWALATMSFDDVYLGNLDTSGMSVAERSSMEEWIIKVSDVVGWGRTRQASPEGHVACQWQPPLPLLSQSCISLHCSPLSHPLQSF